MTLAISDLAKMTAVAMYDPSAVAQSLFATYDRLSINGGDISFVDPNNPFVLALTNQAILASTMAEQAADLNRKLYSSQAVTQEDLYHHMSDKDYLGRFANPSRVTCIFRCQVDDLMQQMVEVPDLNQFKLVIPRNSFLTVDSVEFTLLYPVVIRRQKFGKFMVTYDTDLNSPMMDLTTNLIPFKIIRNDNVDWLQFEFELVQCSITTKNEVITPAADTELNIPIEGEYHYCRVFNVITSGGVKTRKELSVVHNALYYDPNKPTVSLKVSKNKVNAYLPTIYVTNGMRGTLQVDVYTTKGVLDMPLGGYAMTEFVFNYRSTFDEDIDKYVAPLSLMNTVDVFSVGTTSGGSAAKTFEELKEQVVSGGLGDPTLPVADVKLKYALRDLGYDVSLNVDNVPTRNYLATRDLPLPKDDRLHSPISTAIETFAFSGDLSKITKAVIENTDAYTITPKALFQINNGIVTIQEDYVADRLSILPPDKLAEELSTTPYFWTPFYYVIDTHNNRLSLRPYFLDKPEITSRSFETENTSTNLTCSTSGYTIDKVDSGYVIYVYTAASDEYLSLANQELWAQLSFMPDNSNVLAVINGELYGSIDGGHVWKFPITTNYYLDENHNLTLTNFKMYDSVQRDIPIELSPTFNLIFGIDTVLPTSFRPVLTDGLIARHLLTPTAHAITHEYLNAKFGYALDRLWAQARSFSDAKYEVHPTDIQAVYKEDVFEPFPDGNLVNIVNGFVEYNKTHCAGDYVFHPDGEPVYIARAGDYVLDANGLPVPVADRYMLRNVDLFLMEASFRFTNSATAKKYYENTLSSIITWCVKDMVALAPRLLEETKIYFTPKRTAGSVEVQVNNTPIFIQAPQSLTVKYIVISEMTASKLERDRAQIERITSEVLATALTRSIVSVSDVEHELKQAIGKDEVLNVELSGLGGERNLQLVIIPSPTHRLNIAKRVRARASGEIYIEDAITVDIQKERDTYNLK